MSNNQPKAYIVNPYCQTALDVIKSLIDSGVQVYVRNGSENEPDLLRQSQNIGAIAIENSQLLLQEQVNYLLVFLDPLSPAEDETDEYTKSISQNAKTTYIIPSDWDQQTIEYFHRKHPFRNVVVSPEVSPNMNFGSPSLTTRLFKNILSDDPLAVDPYGQNLIFVASAADLATGILENLFTGSRESLKWLIPRPVTLNDFLDYLKRSSLTTPKLQAIDNTLNPPLKNNSVSAYWVPATPADKVIAQTLLWIEDTKRNQLKFIPSVSITDAHLTAPPVTILSDANRYPNLIATDTLAVSDQILPGSVDPQTASRFQSTPLIPVENTPPELVENLTKNPFHQLDLSAIFRKVKNNFFKSIFRKSSISSLQKSKKAYLIIIVVLVFLALSLYPAIRVIGILSQSTRALKYLSAGDYNSGVQSAQNSYDDFVSMDEFLVKWKPVFYAFFLQGPHDYLTQKLSVIENMAYSELTLTRLAQSSTSWLKDQNASIAKQPQVLGDITSSLDSVNNTYVALSQNMAWLAGAPLIGSYVKKISGYVPDLKDALNLGQELVPHVASLGGYDQTKRYLVLLQNNMELRPTGGFIGSYALLSVKGGNLIDMEIQDVYVADGQLKGHVEPPDPIKNVLKEANWYLRDSNFDPDFPTSSVRAQWFFEKETGQGVDGVVAITLDLIQNLLEVTGPITLSDFNEEINKDNFYERTQYHAEANFFAGSTQKQDFLSSLSKTLITKLKNLDNLQKIKMVKILKDALNRKDIQVYFTDASLQSSISKLNLSGQIKKEYPCLQNNCLTDTAFLVDSNFGVNKANYFLKKKTSHQIIISDSGEISHEYSVIFQNNSLTTNWPSGRYLSYLRIYLPERENLVGDFTLKNPSTNQSSNLSNVDEVHEHGLKSYGVTFEVPIKETREISFTYKDSQKLDTGNPGVYQMLLQRQAGLSDEPVDFSIVFPGSLKVKQGIVNGTKINGFDNNHIIRYNLILSGDQYIQTEFTN